MIHSFEPLKAPTEFTNNVHFACSAAGKDVQGKFVAPRQAAPAPTHHCSSTSPVVGVSAFAFQGTNAHLMLAAPSNETYDKLTLEGKEGAGLGLLAKGPKGMQARRIWFVPNPHPLLFSVFNLGAARNQMEISFEVGLNRPQLAYLREHQVGTSVALHCCILKKIQRTRIN